MLQNLRDAGGHPIESGGRVRTGLLFRSDAPAGLDDAAHERIRALSLRTIVDLRRDPERETHPFELEWFRGLRLELSLIGDDRRPVNALNGGLAGFNRWVYETRGETIALLTGVLAAPGALPALLHCTAGKDRTGLVVGLLQSWLGVPDDRIATDYALSAELLHVVTEEAIEKQQVALGVDVRKRPDLLEARSEWIVDALADVRARHGSAERYLVDHGADPDDLRRLRAALVDES
jgi:protein-tyrosine phosphatase